MLVVDSASNILTTKNSLTVAGVEPAFPPFLTEDSTIKLYYKTFVVSSYLKR